MKYRKEENRNLFMEIHQKKLTCLKKSTKSNILELEQIGCIAWKKGFKDRITTLYPRENMMMKFLSV